MGRMVKRSLYIAVGPMPLHVEIERNDVPRWFFKVTQASRKRLGRLIAERVPGVYLRGDGISLLYRMDKVVIGRRRGGRR